MRLMSFRRADGTPSWGIVEGKEVVDCGALAPGLALTPSLRAALASGKIGAPALGAPRHALDAITFLPPIPDPEKILCVGLNYLTHIREGGRDVPKQPTIFTRFANTQIGHLRNRCQHQPARGSTKLDFPWGNGQLKLAGASRRLRPWPTLGVP